MIPNFRISDNFDFYEMTNTRHVGMQTENREWAVPNLFNMRDFCSGVLEPIRTVLGPMVISSGFRCRALNEWVGGSKTSSHTYGMAADVFKPEWDFRGVSEAGWKAYNLCKERGIRAKIIIEAKEGTFWLHINRFSELCLYEGIARAYKRLA
jgi:hypothetical protein